MNYNEDEKGLDIGSTYNGMDAKKILSSCGWFLSLMTIAVFASQFIVSFLLGSISVALSFDLLDSGWYAVVLTAVGMVGVGLPVFAKLMKRIPDSDRGEVTSLSPRQFIGFFLVCVGAAYISNFIGIFISSIIEVINGIEMINPLEGFILDSNIILIMIYASIIAPIVEELIFRKILLDKLRRFGDIPAILISGIAFGLFHMNLAQFFYATVLGILFAYITIRTNRLRYPILLHMLMNFIGSGLVPLITASENIGAMALVGIWVIVTMIFASLTIILNIKKVVIFRPELPLVSKRDYIFNPGTIIFLIISIVMIMIGIAGI